MAEDKQQPPNSVRRLDNAIRKLTADNKAYVDTRSLIANSIVGQLLPDCVVKGGTSLKLRYGDETTRFTTDLDTARKQGLEAFTSELKQSLASGWCGFTGRLVEGKPARPKDVPAHYVMKPFSVKLLYLNKSWCTVVLEVGHNEIGDADEAEMIAPREASNYLSKLGFPELGPIACMPLRFQIAQKLHGVSEKGSERAHDLIDLQVIMSGNGVDLSEVRKTCVRLFSYRKQQSWPPHIEVGENWGSLYAAQAEGLPVLPNVDAAVEWTNRLIDQIDSSA